MLDNLQKQFKRLLKNTELAPPPELWERIEGQLPGPPRRRISNRLAASLILLLSSSIGFFLVYERYLDNGGGDQLARADKIPESLQIDISQTPTENPHITRTKLKSATSNISTSIVVSTSNYTTPVTTYSNSTVSAKQSSFMSGSSEDIAGSVVTGISAITSTIPENVSNSEDQSVLHPYAKADQRMTGIQPDLLASAGFVPIRQGINRQSALQILSPSSAFPVENPLSEKIIADPVRACEREKRLAQFKTFDVVRGFHIGAFISQTSTWMTRKQDYLDHPGNIINPGTYLGMAFGINVGYDINERWGLQTELAIRNSKGQLFDEKCIYTGEEMQKELRLWYLRMPLMVKYKLMQINRPSGRPVVLGVLAGPMVNVLYKQRLYVNDERAPISSAMVNHSEFGAIGGVDVDIYLHKNFYLTAGTRLSLASPVRRNLPMSIQLGFSAQINFRVPPKEKH